MGRYSLSKSQGRQQDHDPINKWPVHGRKTFGSCTKRPKLGTPRDEHQPVNLDGNSVENEPDPQQISDDDDSHNSEEPEDDYDDYDEGDYVYDERSDKKITLTLLDYHILDCPVCLEPLGITIFQVFSNFLPFSLQNDGLFG